jgi:hypothetical protein
MMICLPVEINEQTHPEAYKMLKMLKILCCLQFILGIFLIFIDILSGIWMIFGAFFFMAVIWMKNWCMSVMFIIYCMMNLFTSIFLVGSYFSTEDPSDDDTIYVILYMAVFPFYLVVIFYNFLAYRELKGLFIENIERDGVRLYGAMDTWYERRGPLPDPPRAAEAAPFTGPGYRLE